MSDVDEFREPLRELRREALRSIAELGGTIEAIVSAREGANSDDEHDPEGTTLAFERSQSDALLRQSVLRLEDIDSALRRLDAGTYGRCEVCGGLIGRARLEARLHARTCIRCAAPSRA